MKIGFFFPFLIAGFFLASVQAFVITADPADLQAVEGGSVTLTIDTTDAGLSYQWQKDPLNDGTWGDITGASDSSYVIASAVLDDSGSYRCLLRLNPGGPWDDTSDVAVLTVFPASVYADWSSSATFIISTTADWADIPDSVTVTGFPVLIRLDSSYFDFSAVLANGEDIRFATEDDTPLDYQIELWDAATGQAAIWVKIDTINGNSEQTIKMYWGKADAVDESDGAAVFDTASGFRGVWHLDEEGNTDSAGYADATGNGNHGTGNSMTADSDAPGIIGLAQNLDGGQDYIDCGADTSLMVTDAITVSAWMYHDISTNNGHLVNMGGGWTEPGYSLFAYQNNIRIELQQTGEKTILDNTAPSTGAWHLIALTWSTADNTIRTYIDGVQASNTGNFTGPIGSPMENLNIGRKQSNGNYFDGKIDEARVVGAARSPDWMKLEYENQKSTQNLISLPIMDGCVAEFGVSADTVTALERGNVSVSGIAKCALKYQWSVVVDDSTVVPTGSQGMSVDYTVGRITGDTTFTLRFSALYDTGWASEDVVVEIIDNIPEPEFTITGLPDTVWSGRYDTLIITATVSNLAVIKASPDSIINYDWTTTGLPVSMVENDDSLTLRRAYSDGTLKITLCMDNGGPTVCDSATIEVLRPVGMEGPENSLVRPVELLGDALIWNRPARITIWSIEGRVLFQRTGRKGQKLKLTPRLQRLLTNARQLVEIEAL